MGWCDNSRKWVLEIGLQHIRKVQAWPLICLGGLCLAMSAVQADEQKVRMQTSLGDVVLELNSRQAPISVANFLAYVDDGRYIGTIFHRVIPEFMIQTGGHRFDLSEIEDLAPIRNEADNGLKNLQGTLAFARSEAIDSATGQFYINVSDNNNLDHSAASCTRMDEAARQKALTRGLRKPLTCKTFGYAVFGRVIQGMDVVKAIENVETDYYAGYADVPVTPIVIESMSRID
jgi:cyclophilin family peptidyl-prolyl cis-trans isomerase